MFEILHQKIEDELLLEKRYLEAWHRLDVFTLGDVLLYRPHRYMARDLNANLSAVCHGQHITTTVKVISYESKTAKRSGSRVQYILCGNDSGNIIVTFFNKMSQFHKNSLAVGRTVTLKGRVDIVDYCPHMGHPEIVLQKAIQTESECEPIYSLTYGVNNAYIRSIINTVLSKFRRCGSIEEWLPGSILNYYGLPKFIEALSYMHCTNGPEMVLQSAGHHKPTYKSMIELAQKGILRMKIDEFVIRQCALYRIRQEHTKLRTSAYVDCIEKEKIILESVKLNLTECQLRTLDEIKSDQMSNALMIRLVQGDVGSGKTVVALLSSVRVVCSGFQVAIMAPTEILAQQHYAFFAQHMSAIGVTVDILTGSTPAAKKRKILSDLADGQLQIIIGTHALFSENVVFNKLAYVVIDEQHRFGVHQRLDLILKGENVDVLVMSATPIPRSLTIALFGDMDISRILSMPLGRKSVKTSLMSIGKIADVMESLRRKIYLDSPEKVYWVCPAIKNEQENTTEETNNASNDEHSKDQEKKMSLSNVEMRYNALRELYGETVGMLHGKMSNQEKQDIMNKFKFGNIHILVSTTVIEVGVDVKDATVIVIENAERFGLAQLHQLRGRVGRNDKQSYCILIQGGANHKHNERLAIMTKSTNGFDIAEADLRLRGAGDILGANQSGIEEFRFLDLAEDIQLISHLSNQREALNIPHLLSIIPEPIIQMFSNVKHVG